MGSPSPEARPVREAFYSAEAADNWGAGVYMTPDGREVTATGLFFTQEQGERKYGYPDKVYVGTVLMPAIREFDGKRSHELEEPPEDVPLWYDEDFEPDEGDME